MALTVGGGRGSSGVSPEGEKEDICRRIGAVALSKIQIAKRRSAEEPKFPARGAHSAPPPAGFTHGA